MRMNLFILNCCIMPFVVVLVLWIVPIYFMDTSAFAWQAS